MVRTRVGLHAMIHASATQRLDQSLLLRFGKRSVFDRSCDVDARADPIGEQVWTVGGVIREVAAVVIGCRRQRLKRDCR
jgi:hypothetical protein